MRLVRLGSCSLRRKSEAMAVAPKRGPGRGAAGRVREAGRRRERVIARPDSGKGKSRDERRGGAWRGGPSQERVGGSREVAKSYAGNLANSRHLELSSEGVGAEV